MRWWTNFEKQGSENTLQLALSHPRAITGIYTYIGAGHGGSSGEFGFGYSPATENNLTWVREMVAQYTSHGLTVTPALSISNASVMNGAAIKHVAAAAQFAHAANVSGLMLDFEPATSEIPWVMAYARYVSAFTAAMHAVRKQAEMCVSDWGILDGHFLPHGEGYGVYAKTGVDVMMSMAGTYYGSNVSKNKHNVELEIEQGVSLSQLAVGVGSSITPTCPTVTPPMGCKRAGGACYNWTQPRMTEFVNFIESKGVTQLDIWRADIDQQTNCTEPWSDSVSPQLHVAACPRGHQPAMSYCLVWFGFCV